MPLQTERRTNERVQLRGAYDVTLRHDDVPPTLPDDHLLVRCHYSLISPGSELSFYTGSHGGFANRLGSKDPYFPGFRYPITPGYAAVGVVEAIGARVDRFVPGALVYCPGKHQRFREIVFTALLLPLAIIWIYPFLWMVSAALKSDNEIFSGLGLIPSDFQWGNFSRAWTDARVGDYLLNTVLITFSSVAIVVVTTAMMGYVLGRYSFPGKKIVIGFFVSTVFLPEGYTIIPVFELINFLGLGDSLTGIILAQSGGAHVVTILLFAGYFSQLPKELEEAAILDGAGFLRIFWQIFLPLTKPVVATAIIMQFMYSWNDFLLPLVLTLSRPDLRTLAVGIYSFQGEFYTDWSGMAAAATISLLPIIIVFLFLQRYFVEGIAGAVKS